MLIPQAYPTGRCLCTVKTTPNIKSVRNIGYIMKKDVCIPFIFKPNAKNICKQAITIIPTVPMAKNG